LASTFSYGIATPGLIEHLDLDYGPTSCRHPRQPDRDTDGYGRSSYNEYLSGTVLMIPNSACSSHETHNQVRKRCFTHPRDSSLAVRICTGYAESARFITTPSKKSQPSARFAARSRL